MLNILAVAVGAAVGANLRYGLTIWATQRFGTAFPYGTFVINILGCFLIGIILTVITTRQSFSEPLRLLLVTGLLGGFTTFSSFGWETYSMIVAGNWLRASLYVVGSVLLGLLGVVLGAGVVRLLLDW